MIVLKTVDAHIGGTPLRLIAGGFPSVPGLTMVERLAWADTHADALRRLAMCEPRGHAAMRGAVLTESNLTEAHAGVLFMDVDGFHECSYEGAMAAAVLAVESGLIGRRDAEPIVFDTAVGLLHLAFDASQAARHGSEVVMTGVPSFVLRGGLEVSAGARQVRADIAFGGAFYAIVDSEAAGLPLDGSRDADLRRMAAALVEAVAKVQVLSHPLLPHLAGLKGVVFTAPPERDRADFRIVSVTAGGRVGRGVSGSGMAAVLAVLDAMGLPIEEAGVTLEGGVGSTLYARIARRTRVDDYEAVIPELTGRVWMTGEHQLFADAADPLFAGFVRG